MDSRTAAQTLDRIADLLALRGGERFRSKAYRTAAQAVRALDRDDLTPEYRDGTLAKVPGLGPATLRVIGELIETGESYYRMRLQEEVPEGLLDLTHVNGLTPAKIAAVHEALGVTSVDEFEQAAVDGRLAKVKGFGPKTVERILRGLRVMQETRGLTLWHRAATESEALAESMRAHPDVTRVEVAGAVRRRNELVGELAFAVGCTGEPHAIALSFAERAGVRSHQWRDDGTLAITYVDGRTVVLSVAHDDDFGMAVWRATGSDAHTAAVIEYAASRSVRIEHTGVRVRGRRVAVADEETLYRAFGLTYIPPELREGLGEVERAAEDTLPALIENADIRGVLHCHTVYSDGTATVAEMVAGAQARGWRYLGISDHSMAAFYAGGLKPDDVLRQHEEIDRVNAELGGAFRVYKGIEADILPDGRLDYSDNEALLDRFDFVIGSVHSGFRMTEAAMTERVLRALDDPHLTILAHPTGRILLHRPGYAIDLDAVIERAVERGVALELNADASRSDLDWRWCKTARERGATIVIGPDAHSVRGLDNAYLGVGLARKAWLTPDDVLNARTGRF